MRTSIEIDNELMKRAMKIAGAKTRRETIERALKLLIMIEGWKAIRGLRGKMQWEGDLDVLRRDRRFL